MQDIYNNIPERNHISREYIVAAILCLQCMLHVMLFRPWNIFCIFPLGLCVVCVRCPIRLFCSCYYYYYYYYYYHHHHHHHYYHYYVVVVSRHGSFLPGTFLKPTVIPTEQASSFTLQYFPYYVWRFKYSCLLQWIYWTFSWYGLQIFP